jgi:hypothetical protein
MAPPSPNRPLNVALVLALCAVVFSARLLMGYMHTPGMAPSTPPQEVEWFSHYGELPPLW